MNDTTLSTEITGKASCSSSSDRAEWPIRSTIRPRRVRDLAQSERPRTAGRGTSAKPDDLVLHKGHLDTLRQTCATPMSLMTDKTQSSCARAIKSCRSTLQAWEGAWLTRARQAQRERLTSELGVLEMTCESSQHAARNKMVRSYPSAGCTTRLLGSEQQGQHLFDELVKLKCKMGNLLEEQRTDNERDRMQESALILLQEARAACFESFTDATTDADLSRQDVELFTERWQSLAEECSRQCVFARRLDEGDHCAATDRGWGSTAMANDLMERLTALRGEFVDARELQREWDNAFTE